ncbi:MAG: hypothetical protein ACRC76_10210 [Proteocatella sp.]
MSERLIYKIILDNDENRFFLTDMDVKKYLEENKFMLLVEENTKEKLIINTEHIVLLSEVKNVALKSNFILS